MSENKLIGSLVLRTIDIDPSRTSPCTTSSFTFENKYGICMANGCVITWEHVKIRTC